MKLDHFHHHRFIHPFIQKKIREFILFCFLHHLIYIYIYTFDVLLPLLVTNESYYPNVVNHFLFIHSFIYSSLVFSYISILFYSVYFFSFSSPALQCLHLFIVVAIFRYSLFARSTHIDLFHNFLSFLVEN